MTLTCGMTLAGAWKARKTHSRNRARVACFPQENALCLWQQRAWGRQMQRTCGLECGVSRINAMVHDVSAARSLHLHGRSECVSLYSKVAA
jgi:hypothetical protein